MKIVVVVLCGAYWLDNANIDAAHRDWYPVIWDYKSTYRDGTGFRLVRRKK